MTLPRVAVNDFGIRPAGKPDECFYCFQKVGMPHGQQCVMLQKQVLFDCIFETDIGVLRARWKCWEPYDWDAGMSEFHKRGSTWCASNVKDEWENFEFYDYPSIVKDPANYIDAVIESHACICQIFRVKRIDILDPGPRLKLSDSIRA